MVSSMISCAGCGCGKQLAARHSYSKVPVQLCLAAAAAVAVAAASRSLQRIQQVVQQTSRLNQAMSSVMGAGIAR